MKSTRNLRFKCSARTARVYVAAAALSGLAVAASNTAQAAWGEAGGDPGKFGAVLETAAEFGGDNIARAYFTNGDTQNIKAGQGVTFGAGVHYRPVAFPIDFAATAGYKFVRTEAFDTDIGVDRVAVKLTATYPLPSHFWVAAGPVWHTDIRLNLGNFAPDVHYNDAVGGMVGFGWRWVGVSYTSIKYSGSLQGTVDASNTGITFAWKF